MSSPSKVRLDNGLLVVRHDSDLPDVCLKCGTHESITKRPTTFYFVPLWARLLVLLGVGLLLSLLMREEADLRVPLCPTCLARWNAAHCVRLGAVALTVGAVLTLRLSNSPRAMFGIAAVLLAIVIALALVFSRPRLLQVERIDATHHIHLKGFHTAAAQEIVDGSS